ncbi:hypothetical protein ACJIZ3_020242 [Penstemon smallii]|uniref:Peroxidase n=1 Tax=Penstemon smallii TaxID=265156 RepID=A0ABD3SI93_9LAMI
MAASSLLLPLLLLFPLLPPMAESKLTPNYYDKTCPNFAKIVQETVVDKQLAVPSTAAGTLRLFFHDCVVGGCDASLLLNSNPLTSTAERDHDINKALPGDAFDVIIRTKTKLELICPGIVSCADIIAEATRDLVSMVGGPYYPVRLGRKDSFQSHASDVEGHVARGNMSISRIIEIFAAKGFNVQEMVALTGAHTIGFAHCSEFANRIFDPVDPTLNPAYAQGLQKLCANYKTDPTMAAFFDPMSPSKFDNMYYVNLKNGVALLSSDQAMALDPRTKPFVDLYAANQTAFFEAFTHAMLKVSVLDIKTGRQGEVRRRCDLPNSLQKN